ncbi:unnamed protein product [Porites lobata]|uniref:Phospholipase A2 n=1 Tax=Porites lobata TaxID=104759 RepID=A0ABN8PJV0_9CNID|nr:unnamed protein product [Porites lobata]
MRSLPAILCLVSVVVCVLSFPSAFKGKIGKMPFIKTRHARNLLQFGNMIQCSTNRSMWDYYDYGCWCGYGGSGKPVDGTDRCCLQHDSCYDRLTKNSICSELATYYSYYRYKGCRQCVPESEYPLDDLQKQCRNSLCECDSKAAKCFASSSFNHSYINYNTNKC